ncbi:MAG: hypothetical protein HXX15_18360 [Rhodopseudomonas sp.]|uniref:hypothetical protein n=1 Tax=Rhodopseudomonas sp. TaxID=1078 RepID=UPI0018194EE0|nr:hypothetical protein [Rhodopseudomonas sp.]NVN88047.1 hypothetical protein [Rhodopseudomonas sp.]
MPKIPMPKLSVRVVGQLVVAAIVALVAAAALDYIAHSQLELSPDAVRGGALNGASLVVAFLLVAGIGRSQKDKR